MHRPMLRPMVHKTDSAGSPKILLLGSWNWGEHDVGVGGRGDHFPIQF